MGEQGVTPRFWALSIGAVCAAITTSSLLAGPPPAPAPARYNPGPFINGDFQQGELGWSGWGEWATLQGFNGESWAVLINPEGWPNEGVPMAAFVGQTVVIPQNASWLTFTARKSAGMWDGWNGGLRLNGEGYFIDAGSGGTWITQSVDVTHLRGVTTDVEVVGWWSTWHAPAQVLELDYFGFDPAGSTQVNPIMPTQQSTAGFVFADTPSGTWIDPTYTSGFRYVMNSPSAFTRILDFPTGFGPLTVEAEGLVLGTTFAHGESVDFVAMLGHSVTEFIVRGIDPEVDADDPTSFPLQVEFSTSTADVSMFPLVVPEPTSICWLAVFSSMTLRRRR